MNEESRQIIFDYWVQISFILAIILTWIGYLIKIILEYRWKKKEIKYSIFQQSKIEAIKSYIHSFSECINFFESLNLNKIINEEKLIIDNLYDISFYNNLEKDRSNLKLYINLNIYSKALWISGEILYLHTDLLKLYDNNFNKLMIGEKGEKIREFESLKKSKLSKINDYADMLLDEIRKEY